MTTDNEVLDIVGAELYTQQMVFLLHQPPASSVKQSNDEPYILFYIIF